jgi:hypothetical protein
MNRFLYALANPTTFIDPTGHTPCTGHNDSTCDSYAMLPPERQQQIQAQWDEETAVERQKDHRDSRSGSAPPKHTPAPQYTPASGGTAPMAMPATPARPDPLRCDKSESFQPWCKRADWCEAHSIVDPITCGARTVRNIDQLQVVTIGNVSCSVLSAFGGAACRVAMAGKKNRKIREEVWKPRRASVLRMWVRRAHISGGTSRKNWLGEAGLGRGFRRRSTIHLGASNGWIIEDSRAGAG